MRLELELTNTCNLKCPLCIRQTHPEHISKVKYRELDEIIKQLDTYDLKYITLAGPTSEPTLYPYLFELLQYLINRNIEISLFINGDTHDDMYYRKLSLLFKQTKINSHIYITVCGSTQELHSKYRVGSNLENVLRRLDIINLFSKKGVLNYIIFNYNEHDNKSRFKKYKDSEYFYTLPVQEHFNLNTNIHLPKHLQKEYSKINRLDTNINCPADNYNFITIDSGGVISKCSLLKNFGESHCFECSFQNTKILNKNKIYKLAEPESDTSESELHIKGN